MQLFRDASDSLFADKSEGVTPDVEQAPQNDSEDKETGEKVSNSLTQPCGITKQQEHLSVWARAPAAILNFCVAEWCACEFGKEKWLT